MGEQSEYDDVIAMGEAVEQLGDEPPVIVEPKAEPKAEAEAPAEEQVLAEEELSGGLGETLVDESEEQLDIDKLLGLPRDPEAEAPKQAEPEEPAPVEGEPAAGSLAERVAELSGQLRVLREDNERLTTRQLREPDAAPPEAPAPELEQDMIDYLDPYINAAVEKRVGERLGKVEKAMEPVVNRTHNEQLTAVINSRVDFEFTSKDMDTLYTELNGMSEKDQAFYRDGGPAAVLLAKDLQSRGALGGGKKTTTRTSPLAARHHSEMGGASPANQEDMSEEEKVRRLMAMDPAAIRGMVDGLE